VKAMSRQVNRTRRKAIRFTRDNPSFRHIESIALMLSQNPEGFQIRS
jgi:hypothetical protein